MMKRNKISRLVFLVAVVMCFLCLSAQGLYAYTWSNFRENPDNNGVTEIALPTKAEDATLYWAAKMGEGISEKAPSPPIIVDDAIVLFAYKTVYKLDSFTGEVIREANLEDFSNYNTTPPAYGGGKLFFSLANGKLQAVDAETLEHKWLYQNLLKGEPKCPVTYHNGYVYTGYWDSETGDADYVCVNAETGEEVWTLTHKGGFFWAGCYVNDRYLLVGSDDGVDDTAPSSVLYSVRPGANANDSKEAQVIDKIDHLDGDIRSTVAFVKENDDGAGTAYFTTKGGTFYGVPVTADGHFSEDENRILKIDLGGPSTSTPVIYNGRAYVGVQGEAGQFVPTTNVNEPYTGHRIAVIDLTKKEVAYTCPTMGYVQTSGLLTTAYEETDNGSVYVYFFENYTPGKLRIIKDKPGQTEMVSKSDWAEILFTPCGEQAAYAIGSPICDEFGTMYFKNDSGHIFALGWNMEKIEVIKKPNKTEYKAGETFDPTGMVVEATYANGKTRDVTKYVDFSKEPLTEDDIEITLTFSHLMYRDTDDGNKDNDDNDFNQPVAPFYTRVDIDVTESGGNNDDGNNDDGNKDVTGSVAANAVIAKIDRLDGRISEEGVAAARAAYENLTPDDKALVTNISELEKAEAKIKENPNPFQDVKPTDWYRGAVLFNFWNDLMNGKEINTFAPNENTTRAQLVLILYRYSDSPAVTGTTPFTDLRGDWYKDAVLWANQNGIVNGTSPTTFSPDDNITRQDLVTILHRYCKEYKKMDVSDVAAVSSFPDAGDISSYAMKPFQWAVKQGYIEGTVKDGQKVLNPKGNATRAEIATIMMRFVQSL